MLRTIILIIMLCASYTWAAGQPEIQKEDISGLNLLIMDNDTIWVEQPRDSNAQPIGPQTGKEEIFIYVEQMPEPGYNIQKYLARNLKYPEDAKEAGISGRVVVKFIVRANGTIDSAHVIKHIYPSVDNEALRLINSMPPWKPAKKQGQAVDANYMLPVTFRLE